jgi:aminoglycoside phosphotransferase (APT) family kinase protein
MNLQEGHIQDFLVLKNTFPDEWLKLDGPMGLNFFSLLDGFIERLRLFGECDQYADKIARWDRKKLMEFFLKVAEPMKCGFTVLAHADCWMNNMMFKFNDANEVEDVALIDFQTCSWASPAMDLHYFITSSVHDDVKVECYDEFMKHYYDELTDSLRKLKYEQYIPTIDDFYADLLEKSGQGD